MYSKINRNIYKPPVAESTKEIVRKNFTREIEFFEFCKQRLHKQYLALNLNENQPWNTNEYSKKIKKNSEVYIFYPDLIFISYVTWWSKVEWMSEKYFRLINAIKKHNQTIQITGHVSFDDVVCK